MSAAKKTDKRKRPVLSFLILFAFITVGFVVWQFMGMRAGQEIGFLPSTQGTFPFIALLVGVVVVVMLLLSWVRRWIGFIVFIGIAVVAGVAAVFFTIVT